MICPPIALDEKGRCCGRKPLVYKRPTHYLFCFRCHRYFDPDTRRQIPNWAWRLRGDGMMEGVY